MLKILLLIATLSACTNNDQTASELAAPAWPHYNRGDAWPRSFTAEEGRLGCYLSGEKYWSDEDAMKFLPTYTKPGVVDGMTSEEQAYVQRLATLTDYIAKRISSPPTNTGEKLHCAANPKSSQCNIPGTSAGFAFRAQQCCSGLAEMVEGKTRCKNLYDPLAGNENGGKPGDFELLRINMYESGTVGNRVDSQILKDCKPLLQTTASFREIDHA